MTNIKNDSLRTGSPGRKRSSRAYPLGMGMLCALFVLLGTRSAAQIFPVGPTLPAITVTGSSTICVGTTATYNDASSGGTWSTSNAAVASINTSGLVTGIAGGVAFITYSKGTGYVTSVVTVTYPIQGAATVCAGNIAAITDSTYSGLWNSSNTSVVTVTPVLTAPVSTGQVTGVSAGTAVITYGRTGACYVTENITVAANGAGVINGTGALNVCAGGTVTATETVGGGTWVSSGTAIATVNITSGVINGVTAGGVTITYFDGGCWVTKPLTVTSPSSLLGITGAVGLCVGNTITLSDATPLGAWSGSNASVANVYPGGIVTGVSAGTVTVTYAKGGCAVMKTETVNANTIAAITGHTNVCVGGADTLYDATASGVWASSLPVLASIGSLTGIVSGLSTGTTVVSYSTISYTVGGCYVTTSVVVNPGTSVGAISGSTAVCVGATTAALTDAVTGGAWSSSNTAIGTISGIGAVGGVSPGTFTISYYRLGCAATQVFTVNPNPAVITGSVRECLRGAHIAGVDTLADVSTGGNWSTSNAVLATVAPFSATQALITPVATGVDTIYYTYPTTGCFVRTTDTVYGTASISGSNTVCIAPMTYLELHDATTTSTGGQGTWATSNSAVATVSAGAVTGVTAGTAVISYSVAFSGLVCYSFDTITAAVAPGPISGNFATCVGATTTLTDTAVSGTWASNNTGIATVNSATGVVTGVSAGGVIITYSKNGCNSIKNVTVGAALPAITGPSSVCASYAVVVDTNTTTGGTWSASAGNMEVVQTGTTTAQVTGITAGSAVLSYTLAGCTATRQITIVSNSVGSISGYNTVCTGLSVLATTTTSGGLWTVANGAIATLTGTATPSVTVTGVSAGTTMLTYTVAATGCFKSMAPFYVKQSPAAISGISSICDYATATLSDLTSGGVWASSNSYVASVSTTGVVTGISTGHATVSYNMPGGCAAVIPMEILSMPYAVAGGAAVCSIGGGTGQGDTVVVSSTMTGGVWSTTSPNISIVNVSSNDSMASVVGLSAGTAATITYSMSSACYKTASIKIGTVTPTFSGANPGPLSVCTGGVASTALTVNFSGGTWTSGNTYVASVATGAITGVGVGTVLLSYNLNGCYAFQTETVTADTMAAISGGNSVCVGASLTLSDASGGGTWSSSNTADATVVSTTGVVSGVAPGGSVITYKSSTAGGCIQNISIVVGNVTPAVIGGYVSTAMCVNAGLNLTDATTGGTWSSSNSSIAAVNSTGQITGIGAGTAGITYSLTGCYPAPVVITVNALPVAVSSPTMVLCSGSATTLTDTSGVAEGTPGTWSTSSASVATVNAATGVVTGGSTPGTVNISYNLSSGCSAAYTLTVGVVPVLSGPTTVCTGTTFTITVVPSAATTGTWSNFNSSIESVELGMAVNTNGTAGGVDTLYYTTPGCTAVKYVDTVNYVAPIGGGSSVMCASDIMTISDAVAGGVWSTTGSIATLSPAGLLTSGATGGTEVVTYTVPAVGGTSTTCYAAETVTVFGTCSGRESSSGNGGAIATATQQKYTLYPNPTNGIVHLVQAIAVDEQAGVTVYNYTGDKVYDGVIAFSNGEGQLNLNVASGVYLLRLQDSKGLLETYKVEIVR